MTTLVDRQEAAPAAVGYPTVAALIRDRAERSPDKVAMREKEFGIWQEITWAELWETIRDAAHGLLALGIETGDRVSIQSEDRPEWIILDIAARNLGRDVVVNSKGFRVLPAYFGFIQGDGIDIDTHEQTLKKLVEHKWCVSNLAFGSGGGLLQKWNRDDQKWNEQQ